MPKSQKEMNSNLIIAIFKDILYIYRDTSERKVILVTDNNEFIVYYRDDCEISSFGEENMFGQKKWSLKL